MTRGRNDDIFGATDDLNMSRRADLRDVAGLEPTLYKRFFRFFRSIQVPLKNIGTATEKFPVSRHLYLDTVDGFTHISTLYIVGVIHRYDRRRLRQTVYLKNGNSNELKPLLGLGLQDRRPAN